MQVQPASPTCSSYKTFMTGWIDNALPRLYTVAQEECFLVTIEQRLAGMSLSAVLPALTPDQLDMTMQRYLSASLALSWIQAPPALDRYKLFDPNRLSDPKNGDWHRFLSRYLADKLVQVTPYLARDVPRFGERVQQLYILLDQPYGGDYR